MTQLQVFLSIGKIEDLQYQQMELHPHMDTSYSDLMLTPAAGAGTTVFGGTSNLNIDTNFGTSLSPGLSTSINSRTYNLGMSFVKGVANPEVKKYSGDIIYVDNRAAVTRSSQQKEDIKIVLEF